tara:strand:+ start:218 stop:745 length:528 start_codon:yes stop_codon:yes gene_type:complete
MKKKVLFLGTTCLFVLLATLVTFSPASGDEPLTRSDVAGAIVNQICLEVVPDVSAFPTGDQYEILANALASRGIDNFLGTNPDELFTVGEIEGIYYLLTAEAEILLDDPRANCPIELIPVFAVAVDTQLTSDNLQKILNCFPECNLTTEIYTAPIPFDAMPDGPEFAPEEPANEI